MLLGSSLIGVSLPLGDGGGRTREARIGVFGLLFSNEGPRPREPHTASQI